MQEWKETAGEKEGEEEDEKTHLRSQAWKSKSFRVALQQRKAVLLDGNSSFSYIFITFKILQIKSQLIILLVPQEVKSGHKRRKNARKLTFN